MSLQVWLPLVHDLHQQGLSTGSITSNNASFDTNGKLGGCYVFSGVDNAIGVGNLSTMTSTDFTFTCWFYHDDTWSSKGWETIFGGPSGFELQAKNSTTNSPVIYLYSWGKGNFTYELNKWNHLAMVRTTSETKIYLNGELKITGSAGSIPNGNYFIGSWRDATSQNFKGKMCDVRIYNNALSSQEIKEISKGLVLHYPLTGQNNSLVPYGYEQLEYIESTGASYFNTNCYFNPETDSCKVTFQGTDTSNNGMILANSSGRYFWMYYYRAGSRITIYADNGSGQENTGGSVPLDLNKHTIEYYNKTYYFDGTSKGVLAKTYTQDTGSALSLFSYGGANYVFKGKIYYTNIKRGNKYERVFIPARKISNSTIGMYDVIHDVFYVSESSTPFTAGPVITTPNIIYDTSGFNNNGTISGDLTINSVKPKYGSCIYMNAATVITHPCCLSKTTDQEWTCMAWVKLDTISNYPKLNDFNTYGNYLNTSSSKPLLYLNAGNDDYYIYGNSSSTLPENTWVHIAFVFRNSDAYRKIYINGVDKSGSGPNKTSTPRGLPNTITIGPSLTGYISDYREYATVLSQEDVIAIYQNEAAFDDQGNILGPIR